MAEELAMPNAGMGAPRWPWKKAEYTAAWRDAATRYESYAQAHPKSGRVQYAIGIARLQLDEFEASGRAFLRALDLGYRRPATLYNLACVESRRGEKEKAFEYLDQAIDAGFDAARQIRADEDLDNLRGDPRYPLAIRKADARAQGKTGLD